MTIGELNLVSEKDATQILLHCCGSQEWAVRMAKARPFANAAELIDTGDRTWLQLGEVDWLEAFAAHPRIGEGADSLSSQREQASSANASEEIRAELARLNGEYEKKFGFMFIVYASGRSSGQLLELLRGRLHNDHDTELHKAGAEQMKITRLRLQRLVEKS